MFGFIIGTACLIGIGFVVARGRRKGRWRRHRFSPVHSLLEHIDASPAQERSIIAVIDTLRDRAREARRDLRRSLENISNAMRAPSFDRNALESTIAGHVETIRAVENEAADALGKIYDLLDERQRSRLADAIESGGRGLFYGYGHHRHC